MELDLCLPETSPQALFLFKIKVSAYSNKPPCIYVGREKDTVYFPSPEHFLRDHCSCILVNEAFLDHPHIHFSWDSQAIDSCLLHLYKHRKIILPCPLSIELSSHLCNKFHFASEVRPGGDTVMGINSSGGENHSGKERKRASTQFLFTSTVR